MNQIMPGVLTVSGSIGLAASEPGSPNLISISLLVAIATGVLWAVVAMTSLSKDHESLRRDIDNIRDRIDKAYSDGGKMTQPHTTSQDDDVPRKPNASL